MKAYVRNFIWYEKEENSSQDCIAKFRERYLSARDVMCRRLDELRSVFEYQKPREFCLMFPKILLKEGKDLMVFCKKLLKEVKVSTIPGIVFGPKEEGYLNITFSETEKIINKQEKSYR